MEKLQVQKKRPMNENITLFKYLDVSYTNLFHLFLLE